MRRPRLIEGGLRAAGREMSSMGVDPVGIRIMEGKARHLLIRFDDVDLRAALILKQDMLSLGGDAALRREAAGLKIDRTPVLLMGTESQMRGLTAKMEGQPFGLKDRAALMGVLLSDLHRTPRFIVDGADLLSDSGAAVAGILNVTEDSFSDGGKYLDREAAVARGLRMVEEGADIVDVGGESTRPGAGRVNAREELDRVIPVIRDLSSEGVRAISVDTTRALVAEKAVEAGAGIINDISGMTFDRKMLPAAAASGASVVLMHTRGRPDRMQEDLHYDDLMGEVCAWLEGRLEAAVSAGIPVEKVCLDPGIGFGKSGQQNFELLARIGEIRSYGTAVMAGASRKAFIGKATGQEVHNRTAGSVAAASAAVLNGANIVRVHDVAETVQALRVISALRGFEAC